jgi:hypothetical protein
MTAFGGRAQDPIPVASCRIGHWDPFWRPCTGSYSSDASGWPLLFVGLEPFLTVVADRQMQLQRGPVAPKLSLATACGERCIILGPDQGLWELSLTTACGERCIIFGPDQGLWEPLAERVCEHARACQPRIGVEVPAEPWHACDVRVSVCIRLLLGGGVTWRWGAGYGNVEMPWWTYGSRGMQLWFPSCIAEPYTPNTRAAMATAATDPELEFDREVYPIGISLAEVAIVGARIKAHR